MADPLAALSSAPPTSKWHQQSPIRIPSHVKRADSSLSGRWNSFFRGGVSLSIESLRARAIEGKISQDQDASLRWIQWKLFLTQHISSIPSSWSALLGRERDTYNELRCRLLRAPDGNYPPQLGFDGTYTTLDSVATLSSSSSRNSPYSDSRRPTCSLVNDLSVNNPLSLDESNPWKTYYSALETRRIILQDVERSFPDLDVFRQTSVQQALTNILFLWALQNEDVGYRQGMHELAALLWKVRSDGALDARHLASRSQPNASTQSCQDTPFQHALADVFVEHDVYALFCVLMQSAKCWYAWRDSASTTTASQLSPAASPSSAARKRSTARESAEQPRRPLPIVAKCEYILDLLRHIDPALAQHLETLGIEPQIFCLRWIRMIFTREFALDNAIAIWDGLFSSAGSLELIDYICIAMLLRIRNQLLAADHTSALQSLLRYPAEAQVQPSLLVKQAIYMRDHGRQPSTGVTVVMQNRDLLGIAVRSVDGSSQEASTAQHAPASPTQRYGAQKFATVGRVPSAAGGRPSPWGRLQGETNAGNGHVGTHLPRPDARRWQGPASARDPLGAAAADSDPNAPRAFGINPSAYLPEGVSDFAKSWYERAELPQTLNSALANVSRTVAAAAAGAYGTNKPETSGFPSGFNQAFSAQTGPRSSGTASTVGHAESGRTRPKLPIANEAEGLDPVQPAQPVSIPRSSAELADQLAKLTTANRAIGSALSACIGVLEQNWLDRNTGSDSKRDDLEQRDLNTLMSFTALKHIRDVLDGRANEFDPATLPASIAKKPSSTVNPTKTKEGSVGQRNTQQGGDIAQHAATKGDSSSIQSVQKEAAAPKPSSLPMSLPEYARYGRQMILPDFGLPGQLRLRNAKVLVVGAGGLGCPAVQYLAAAGVGQISILDHDVVEPSNLARQILHSDGTVGMSKAVSAAKAAKQINPYITAVSLAEALSSTNARQMMRGHDLVLDCTDNPLTRYLISDAAVLEGVEVVSGAAQGYDGQLVVLHKRIKPEFAGPKVSAAASNQIVRGPCYRCLFPMAPRPDEVTNCEDGGVLGGITGLVGTMQALEAVKILAGIGEETPPFLTLVSPLTSTPFRCVKIRPRRISTCRSCGDPAQVTEPMIANLETEDYVSFCGLNAPPVTDGTLRRTRVSFMDPKALVVDVRSTVEYGITKLDGSLNLPIQSLLKDREDAWKKIHQAQQGSSASSVLVVCKKGNDSQLAVQALLKHQDEKAEQERKQAKEEKANAPVLPKAPAHPLDDIASKQEATAATDATANRKQSVTALQISDLAGGLRAYAKEKDPNFPVY